MLERKDADIEYVLILRHASDISTIPFPHRSVIADILHYSKDEQLALPRILKATGADLAFFPHFNAPFYCPLPFVATVHDLILHRYPGDSSALKRMVYRILVHRALRRAQRVIAVSQWTKDDIRRAYGDAMAKKTTVIGEGVNDMYIPQSLSRVTEIRKRYSLSRPYFLYVGNCKPHKNVPMLLEAFTHARPDAELVLVSGGADAKALTLPAGVRLLSNVEDADLPGLYGAARCFVTASLEEGYCLPVAEALACGCPVIATNRSAIPEILNGHGRLVEPTLAAFSAAFLDPPTLAAPVVVGLWDDAAKATVALLRTVA